MKQPLVTIAIPTYNRAQGYLRLALESALAQTYAPLEIIVADNCSSDDTSAVVARYRDPRVRYVRRPAPVRPNDNFNLCLSEARGAYFQLLHDDDLVDPDFVSCCMQALAQAQQPVGLIRTGARVIDARGQVTSRLENETAHLPLAEFCLAWLGGRTAMLLCASLFNTESLRQVGGFNSKHQLFQDVLAEFRVAARFGRLDLPQIKASFRKHGDQNTNVARVEEWCEDSMQLLEELCALAPTARHAIQEQGLRKFTVHNYNLARAIPNPLQRYRAFFRVYRTFRYSYSPARFALHRAAAQVRALLSSSPAAASAR